MRGQRKRRCDLVRKMLLAALMFMVSILPISSNVVYATTPTLATGSFTVTSFSITGTRTANGNTFIDFLNTEALSGTFAGTSSSVISVIVHPSGDFNVVHIMTFTGIVNGRSGTMIIKFEAKGTGFGYGAPVSATWVIQDGTGDLVGIHGTGTFEGHALIGGTYSGQIHFDPS
jgi:hypothetical protein